MNDNSILLELTVACYNKVESEFLIDKYLSSSPLKTMKGLLESNGFISLHNFTAFLIHKYGSELNLNEIFILVPPAPGFNDQGTYLVMAKQRQILLSFFKSVIRDLQLKQLVQ
jgi:hypothetical protein